MKPALHSENVCSRFNYKALPAMKPMSIGKPPVNAQWPIDDALDQQYVSLLHISDVHLLTIQEFLLQAYLPNFFIEHTGRL
jgi:hypothetical protein